MGGLARLWLPAYLSALAFGCRERGGGGGEELEEEEEEEEEGGEEEGEEVCVRGGGFGISCSVVVAVSARVSLLLSVFEQQRLCSAAGVEREHFVPLCVCVCVYVCVQAGVCVCVCVCVRVWQFLAQSDCVHSCNAPAVCVRLAVCDHDSPAPASTLNMDQYQ